MSERRHDIGTSSKGPATAAMGVTERERAEKALRESEERLRQVAENIREVFWLLDHKTYQVIYVNPAYEEIWGRTCKSLYEQPQSWLEAVHPEDRQRVIAGLTKQEITGEFVEEFRVIRLDGSVRWVLDRGFPIRDEAGKVYRVVGIAADITERKQAEAERTSQLQSANAQLRHELSERRRAEKALAREVAERTVLAEIGIIVGSSLDIDQVYERFAEEVRKLIPFDRMSIDTVDVEAGTGVPAYHKGSRVPGREVGDIYPLEGSSVEAAVLAGSGLLRSGTDLDELTNEIPGLRPAVDAGYRSFITVPLVSADAVVGAIVVHHKDRDAYSPHDLTIAGRIGAQIAGAFANSGLNASLRRESQEREALAEVGRIVSSSLDVDEVYDRFSATMSKVISFDRMSVATINLARDQLSHAYVIGVEVPGWHVGDGIDLTRSVHQWSMRNRKGHMLGAHAEALGEGAQKAEASARSSGLLSGMTIPLVWNDQVIGTFNLRSKRPNAYGKPDLEFAERVGAQVAGAIANTQLHASLQRESTERDTLATIGRIINSTLDIDEIYRHFAELLRKLISFDRISIMTADLEAYTLTRAYVAGADVPGWSVGGVFSLSDSDIEPAIRAKMGHGLEWDSERLAPEARRAHALALEAGLRSGMTIPLISNDQVIGAFNLRSKEPKAYGPRDLELAERVGAHVAGAMANAQLHASLQRESTERDTLATIGRIITSTIDINEIYRRFAEELRKLISFDRISIMTADLEADTLTRAYVAGTDVPGWSAGGVFSLSDSDNEPAIRAKKGRPLERDSKELAPGERRAQALALEAGLRSGMMIPLISNDQVIGTFNLRSKDPNAYGPRDLELAERVGAQVAGAIANAQLFEERRRAEEALRESGQRIRELAAATVQAHEEERQWSAIEVHDRISQPLVGLAHNIQAQESMASGDSKMRSLANRAFEFVQQAIGASRDITNYLYPPGLEEFGIVPLLETDLHRFQEDTGSEVTLDADSEVVMPQVLTVTLYRIFQEALTNIRRHATGTKMVAVSVRCTGLFASLEVKDDGAGFDVKSSKPEGRVGGLMIMSRRAEIIGGTLDISSTQGQGTTVTVHVPIDGGNL